MSDQFKFVLVNKIVDTYMYMYICMMNMQFPVLFLQSLYVPF